VGWTRETGFDLNQNTRPIFRSEPAVFWIHTHPGYSENAICFSAEDLACLLTYRREAFIFAVASLKGVSALAQTKESFKIPFSTIYRACRARNRYMEDIRPNVSGFPKRYDEHFTQIAKEFGLGHYRCVFPSNPCVENGIVLIKQR